jgi:hypothetical protein
MPVAAVAAAMLVVSMTKLRTWRKKTLTAAQFKLDVKYGSPSMSPNPAKLAVALSVGGLLASPMS